MPRNRRGPVVTADDRIAERCAGCAAAFADHRALRNGHRRRRGHSTRGCAVEVVGISRRRLAHPPGFVTFGGPARYFPRIMSPRVPLARHAATSAQLQPRIRGPGRGTSVVAIPKAAHFISRGAHSYFPTVPCRRLRRFASTFVFMPTGVRAGDVLTTPPPTRNARGLEQLRSSSSPRPCRCLSRSHSEFHRSRLTTDDVGPIEGAWPWPGSNALSLDASATALIRLSCAHWAWSTTGHPLPVGDRLIGWASEGADHHYHAPRTSEPSNSMARGGGRLSGCAWHGISTAASRARAPMRLAPRLFSSGPTDRAIHESSRCSDAAIFIS